MKYIFRCALLLNFTDNREGVTISDLRESLAQLKYNCPSVEASVKQWSTCIQQLVDASPLKPGVFATTVKRHAMTVLSEQEIQDLSSVWESESELIFMHRLKQSVGHASLDRLEWSVNNKMYGKHSQNVNQLTTIVNMTLKHPSSGDKKSYITFELDKGEVEHVGSQLRSIEAAIDRLMSQPE